MIIFETLGLCFSFDKDGLICCDLLYVTVDQTAIIPFYNSRGWFSRYCSQPSLQVLVLMS